MELSLKHGSGRQSFSLPDELVAGVHDVTSIAERLGEEGPLDSCEAPLLEGALEELRGAGFTRAVRGARVGLLLADGSRKPPGEGVWEPVLAELAGAEALDVFLCTGTHDGGSPENVELFHRLRALLDRVRPEARLLMHDARAGAFDDLGHTSRGTVCRFHPELAPCRAFLVLSDFKPHYFAGYSNPAKYYLPGLTSLESVRGNHSWVLDGRSVAGVHPWHPDPARRDNPVAADMVEALEKLMAGRPHFALATVTGGDSLRWAGGGETAEVSGRAMLAADRFTTLEVEPTRFLVVSNGGAPYDESLYAAQRALELTRGAVLEGGEVLWLAECTNGLGPGASRENFVEPLARPLEEVLRIDRAGYVLYSHKAWKFADYLQSKEAVYLSSRLPAADVERIHLRPASDPQLVVDHWVRAAREGDRIRFVDDASRLLVRTESHKKSPFS